MARMPTRGVRTRGVTATAALAVTTTTALLSCDAPRPAEHRSAAPLDGPGRVGSEPTSEPTTFVAATLVRAELHEPGGAPMRAGRPIVTFLHGLGDRGANFERALAVPTIARSLDFAWLAPDGTPGPNGQRFWNAGRACCDFAGTSIDHARAVAERPATIEREGHLPFGPRVLVGFSNGAFLAHRIACDAGSIDAVVALAGAPPGDDDPPCEPKRAVATIVIHGDADRVVPYAGGPLLRRADRVVPGATATASYWATRNGCAGGLGPATARDLVPELPGEETVIGAYAGCRAPVELWTVRGADHVGVLSPPLVEAALARTLAPR